MYKNRRVQKVGPSCNQQSKDPAHTSVADEIGILHDDKCRDRDEKRKKFQRRLNQPKFPAIVYNMTDELEVEGIVRYPVFVVVARPFPVTTLTNTLQADSLQGAHHKSFLSFVCLFRKKHAPIEVANPMALMIANAAFTALTLLLN